MLEEPQSRSISNRPSEPFRSRLRPCNKEQGRGPSKARAGSDATAAGAEDQAPFLPIELHRLFRLRTMMGRARQLGPGRSAPHISNIMASIVPVMRV